MTSPLHDVVIVGAGPAGLAAAWAARARGLRAILVDRADRIGGAWARMPADTHCLSPRRHDRFADGTVPPGAAPRASAAEVLAGLDALAARAALDVRLGVEVRAARREDGTFTLDTATGPLRTRRLVVASGEFERPFTPALPGRFDGPTIHARHLAPARVAPGEHVLVVGAGNSGADVTARLLARGARVTLSARTPPGRAPSPITDGEGPLADLLFRLSGIPVRLLPRRGGCLDATPLVDRPLFDAIASRAVTVVAEATSLDGDHVGLRGGARVRCDRVVWATGYLRDTAWLSSLIPLDERGRPREREGLSLDMPGLGFVGLPCQRTRRSGFLRGFVDDAAHVIGHLR